MSRYPFGELPWFVPGLVLSMAVGLFACRPLGRWLDARPAVAWAIIVAVGAILFATLAPLYGAFDLGAVGTGTCDLSRIGLAPISKLVRLGDTSLNVALFVPLGIAISLAPTSRRRSAVILAAIAFPIVIEAIQLLAPILDRGCQSADVIDNLTGLIVGLAVGTGLQYVGRRPRQGASDSGQ